MRPAVIALALALALFLLVQGIRPPLLYAALLVTAAILIYGFIAEELPETPFEDEGDIAENEADRGGSPPGDRK